MELGNQTGGGEVTGAEPGKQPPWVSGGPPDAEGQREEPSGQHGDRTNSDLP